MQKIDKTGKKKEEMQPTEGNKTAEEHTNSNLPVQLSMFFLPDKLKKDYSNSIELYDTMPKYVNGNVKRVNNTFLYKFTKEFYHRGKKLNLTITPALIVDANGKEKAYYPSKREELVEDVLRKFVAEGRGEWSEEKQVGVIFSLYELHKELKKRGHGYDLNDIKESIDILSKTNLELTSEDGSTSFNSNMFEKVGFTSEKDNRKYVVSFNSLVTKSIMDKSWRLLNYDKCMQYKKVVSRWLHKRISHIFLQATTQNPYTIKLSTIVRDSGMKEYKLISGSIRQVEDCLKEMIQVGTLDKYEATKVFGVAPANKIEDVIFDIYVSSSFVSDIKMGHSLYKDQPESSLISLGEGVNNQDSFLLKTIKEKLLAFNLSQHLIESYVGVDKTEEEYGLLLLHIKAAEEYIAYQLSQKKSVVKAAIIKKAISEEWLPKNQNEVMGADNNNQIAKVAMNSSLDNTEMGKYVKQQLIKHWGVDIFNSWFSKMNIVDYKTGNTEVVFLVETKFIRDWILKEFYKGKLGGKQKGLKQICVDFDKNIREVTIKS